MKNIEKQNLIIKKSWENKKRTFKPEAISLSHEELLEVSYLQPEELLPLVVKPKLTDLNLKIWAQSNMEFIEANLLRHGGILFRGFNVSTQTDFEQFIDSISSRLMPYMEGATPRTKLSEKIYTSTEFPPDQFIALHNELSYVMTWPMNIWFCCIKPANLGGQTPIADMRKVFQRIHPQIRKRFMEKGWMLVRNFGDGFGLRWQKTFNTTDKMALEEYCRKARIEIEWKGDNRLKTRQIRPSVAKHPKTGEMVWFNHIAFWHISSLEPKLCEMLLAEFNEEDLPYNTYYGDGSSIEASVIDEIREAYQQETVAFPWHQGDILMLDNMLVAHGRNPYEGSRKVLVAMGEPFTRTDI
ncbi:MAG: TauD/TfdA family dioxygenase [Nostoc sp. DedSLP03]|uniref:TauD/TfdA family dioxygenase n=1 Tax=Nostoc sp. DedSLP03 TaxID=3075400 RepID=UPI002AD467F7|nr:TauD/TfdA family dioxygenase [Nostoc sp. DedSLP03]MDZ7963730.1 TauD/TfdA family dioxygenase [Nostoc sp. DedSLP03]